MLYYYATITHDGMVGQKDSKLLTGERRKEVADAIINAIKNNIHLEMQIFNKVFPVLDKHCDASRPHIDVFDYVLRWLWAKGRVFALDFEYHVPTTKMEKALAKRLTTYIDYCKHHHKHGEIVEN